jgi:hypothetical protein
MISQGSTILDDTLRVHNYTGHRTDSSVFDHIGFSLIVSVTALRSQALLRLVSSTAPTLAV